MTLTERANEFQKTPIPLDLANRKIDLSENARTVLEKRYLRRGDDGKSIETEQEMFWRVAYHVALAEKTLGGDEQLVEYWARKYFDLLTNLEFFPNSPTFTGAGTPLGQLSACFVLRIDDDMGRTGSGIFETLRHAALIQQTGGGNGFSFSRLRPKGAIVKSSSGQATGPVGFLRVYDQAFGEIAQGGSRRGANMSVLRIDHPDIREFIKCKSSEGTITNFNISVGITDEFMRCCQEGKPFDLVNPQDGKVWETVDARELFDMIVKYAHNNGEPGVLFLDAANRENPVPHLYELESTNPCVTGDTLVATPAGWRRADEIQEGDEISTVLGTGRVESIEVHEAMPVYRVSFSDGGSLRVTAAHQFYIYNLETNLFEPRRLDQMKIGDWALLCRNYVPEKYVIQTALELAGQGSESIARALAINATELSDEDAVAVVNIAPAGIEKVYDLYEPYSDTWITEGYVSRGCGEQWLGPFENCCLGSVNLARHITDDDQVDWEKLADSVAVSTRFLDDVVTANAYVPAIPELREAAEKVRRIGLGIMGLADMMYALGIRYGSPKGQEFASQVMEFVRYHSMKTSIELARERGAFPAIEGSRYDPDDLKWTAPKPLVEHITNWGRPNIDWRQIEAGITNYGIRNGAQTTIAPTGTISTVSGCEGYGCEPVFALAYVRYVNTNAGNSDERISLQYTSPLFERALRRAGLDQAEIDRIIEQVNKTGSCQDVPEVPEPIRRVFVTAGDITAEEHIWMQAVMQAHVDNAISKCVVGDTLVLTSQGLVPVAELSQLRRPDQFKNMEIDIVSPHGIEKADAFYYGGIRETRRVSLSYGYEIEGTPNHRIHVLSAGGTVLFARLDELKLGDTVVLYTGQQVFGPAGQKLPGYHGEWRANFKKIRFPEAMSTDLAYILGCITSEGSISRNGVMICNGDRKLLENLGTLFEKIFGLNSHIVKDNRRESVFTLQVNSRALRNWLFSGLGMRAGARNKTIPSCILRASREEIVAFLRGLFLDAYMIEDGNMFGIGLANHNLLKQLQVLFLNFGIFSRIHHTGQYAWALTVAASALEKLAAIIEFDEIWKNERISRRYTGRKQHLFNFATLVPYEVSIALRQMQVTSSKSLRTFYGEQNKAYQRARVNLLQGHRMDRETAVALYEYFDDVQDTYTANFFADNLPNCIYVEVENIEKGFAEVFDISVPGSHTFIANGLGNHNTCNFPANATEADVAKAYFLGWKLGCKGLTVFVTGSREKVVLETAETREKRAGKSDDQPEPKAEPQPLPLFNEKKKPRPGRLTGYTYRIETPVGTTYITINENGYGEGQPFEVFIQAAKAGSETAAVSEAMGRLLSLILRQTSPVPPRERVKEMVNQLRGIGGGRQTGFGPNRVASLPDGIAQVLQEYLDDTAEETPEDVETAESTRQSNVQLSLLDAVPVERDFGEAHAIGDLCPDCGNATLIREEGCLHCYTCGYSEC